MTRLAQEYLPSLPTGNQPIYIRLADKIEYDIDTEILPAGAKLPPMRNLAFDLGVTIGTISRAYNLIRERGLVAGEVGRGTYVLERNMEPSDPEMPMGPILTSSETILINSGDDGGNLPVNFEGCAAPDVGQAEIISRAFTQAIKLNPSAAFEYANVIPDDWRSAGAKWLSVNGWIPEEKSIIPTIGADAAILSVIMTVTAPGDRVVFEMPTYGPVGRTAMLSGRRVLAVETDEYGIDPDAFEKLCAREHPKLVFLMPSVSNPTLTQLSQNRRIAVADIARRYNVWIIEDQVYAQLVEDNNLPIAAHAPERTFVLSSLSKTVSSSLRVGWISAPKGYGSRLLSTHRLLAGPPSGLAHTVCALLVHEGIANELRDRAVKKTNFRKRKLLEVLRSYDIRTRSGVPYAWLKLPEPLTSSQFRGALFDNGIRVSNEDHFKPIRSDKMLYAVRIAFSTSISETKYEESLLAIRNQLESGIAGVINTP